MHRLKCERCRTEFFTKKSQQRFCSISCGSRARQKPGLEPSRSPDLLEIAWAAGVYEGEGSVYGNGLTHGLQVSVGQKNDWLLVRMREMFGGTVSGLVKGRNVPIWTAGGDKAEAFLLLIYQWLSPRRRDQIDAALLRTRRKVA